MEIRLKVNDVEVTATLVDSTTTREFIALLPLTLTLEDYAGTEKISQLPQQLSINRILHDAAHPSHLMLPIIER